jgi:hypothetical protein
MPFFVVISDHTHRSCRPWAIEAHDPLSRCDSVRIDRHLRVSRGWSNPPLEIAQPSCEAELTRDSDRLSSPLPAGESQRESHRTTRFGSRHDLPTSAQPDLCVQALLCTANKHLRASTVYRGNPDRHHDHSLTTNPRRHQRHARQRREKDPCREHVGQEPTALLKRHNNLHVVVTHGLCC